MKYVLNVWCKMRVLRKIKSETSLTIEDNNHINRSHLYNRSQSFHQEIRFALVLSQCFGVMPLHNVGKNVEDVQFKFLSLRFLYSLIHFGCVFATGVAAVVKMALHGFLIDETCKYYYVKPKVFCKNSLFQLLPVSIFSIRSPQFILCTLLGDGKKYWRNTLTLKCQWGIIIPVKMWRGETFWRPRSLCFLDSVSVTVWFEISCENFHFCSSWAHFIYIYKSVPRYDM